LALAHIWPTWDRLREASGGMVSQPHHWASDYEVILMICFVPLTVGGAG
jgi:hypothetical protein